MLVSSTSVLQNSVSKSPLIFLKLSENQVGEMDLVRVRTRCRHLADDGRCCCCFMSESCHVSLTIALWPLLHQVVTHGFTVGGGRASTYAAAVSDSLDLPVINQSYIDQCLHRVHSGIPRGEHVHVYVYVPCLAVGRSRVPGITREPCSERSCTPLDRCSCSHQS